MTPVRELRPVDAALRRVLPPQTPQPNVTYRPSMYALSAEGRVWNTLTQQCVEGRLPETARAFEGWDDLIRSYMLVPEGKDEVRFYMELSALMRACLKSNGYRGYTVLPTLCCNARCVYCYEQGQAQTSMTDETALETARFILSTHGEEPVSISWFGGEPLLRPDIPDRISGELERAGVRYRADMITNGSLVTPDIIRRMTSLWNLREVQVSMDGDRDDYARRKRYIRGGSEYDDVLRGIDGMARAGIHVKVRCNVDRDNWPGVGAFLRDLSAAVTEKNNVAVYFCPLDEVRTGPDDLALWTEILKARPMIRAAGFRIADSILGSGLFRVFHCMADMDRVVIGPDGSLYPCDHCPPEVRFGDIRQGVTDEQGRRAFCRTDHVREKCARCPYLPLCTAFDHCPVKDTHCRELRDMDLKWFVQQFGPGFSPTDSAGPC